MSLVKDTIVEELNAAVEKSKEFADKMKSAKTKIKSDTYHKKLKRR